MEGITGISVRQRSPRLSNTSTLGAVDGAFCGEKLFVEAGRGVEVKRPKRSASADAETSFEVFGAAAAVVEAAVVVAGEEEK